jgi:WD40 repeat protein
VRLVFIPFDPRQEPGRFSLQWPADSKWVPWAIATTPDASTVVVIAQETDSGSSITARFGRIRALIYHPGGFKTAPAAWPIAKAFELKAPTDTAWSRRFAVLDPSGRTLLYWNSDTSVMRYDTADGKPLGILELGEISAHSRDGSRVAAVSPLGRLRVYDLSSGDTLLDVAGKPASGLCFSADGSRVVAAQDENLNTYDIASARQISSVRSSLIPLAYPSRGNRFLAFQPDTSGAGGSVVLADTADAHVGTVLNRAGGGFTPAFFSDSGDQIAVVRDRNYAEVVRSVRPEEFSSVLNTGLPEITMMETLTPTNIVTTPPASLPGGGSTEANIFRASDVPALLSHLGDTVTVEGHVQSVSIIRTGNAANIYFAQLGDRAIMVWVWVPFATYPKLTTVFGQNLGAVLNDHDIRATGRLTKYKDNLEVTLDDPSKLLLLTPAAKSN